MLLDYQLLILTQITLSETLGGAVLDVIDGTGSMINSIDVTRITASNASLANIRDLQHLTVSRVQIDTHLSVSGSTFLGDDCGTDQVNAGTVNVIATTDSSTMAQMPIGEGVTQQCIFHIPRNHTFLTEWLHLNVLNQAQDAELRIKMWVYSIQNNGKQEVFRVDVDTSKTNNIDIIPNLPFPISESSVVWLECTTNKNNIVLNARFDGILERII